MPELAAVTKRQGRAYCPRVGDGREKNVKTLLLVLVMVSLVAVYAGTARAYDPYYYAYDSYNVSVQYVPPYDPYYELHQIHYQLYLRPYYRYPYPYYVLSPVQVFVIGGQPKEIRPGQQARKR